MPKTYRMAYLLSLFTLASVQAIGHQLGEVKAGVQTDESPIQRVGVYDVSRTGAQIE